MVVVSRAGLQTMLETDEHLFSKNLDQDAADPGQMGSGSWEDRWSQKVIFMPWSSARWPHPTQEIRQLPWGTGGYHCQGAMVGNTGKKRLQEGFHGEALTPRQGMTFGSEARIDDRETCGVTLVLPARDLGRCPLKI